jgi:hypothetical protein
MSEKPDSITVFISYSWDTAEHKQWVARLAQAIEEEPDLHVVFDGFDIYGGKVLPDWMERGLECERVVIVSTPGYVDKAKRGHGGVAYEDNIITADLVEDVLQDKFIPVLREGEKTPSFLRTRARVDARDPRPFAEVLMEVLAAIRRQPAVKRPAKRGTEPLSAAPATLPPPEVTERVPSEAPSGSPARHRPPPPPLASTRKPLPGRASLGFSFGRDASTFAFIVSNSGERPVSDIILTVRFSMVPSFVLRIDTLDGGAQVELPLTGSTARLDVDAYPLALHFAELLTGNFANVTEHDHIEVRYRESNGVTAVTAYYPRPAEKRTKGGIPLRFVPLQLPNNTSNVADHLPLSGLFPSSRNVPYHMRHRLQEELSFPYIWIAAMNPTTLQFTNGPTPMFNVMLEIYIDGMPPHFIQGPDHVEREATAILSGLNFKHKVIKRDAIGLSIGKIYLRYDTAPMARTAYETTARERGAIAGYLIRVDSDGGTWLDPLPVG